MAKYIIELCEEPMIEEDSGRSVYRAKDFNTLVFDENGIKKLRTYTNDDKDVRSDYNRGGSEAWYLAYKITSNEDLSYDEVMDIYGVAPEEVLDLYSFHEANELYMKWINRIEHFDDLYVGDEVTYAGQKWIVTRIKRGDGGRMMCNILGKNGATAVFPSSCLERTGRHVDVSVLFEG